MWLIKRVLAVDDNADLRALLGDALKLHGYETWLAADGLDALKLVNRLGPPDLLIADIRMPLMDGCQLIGIVTERYSIPAIALTGDQDAVVPGATVTFRKPCDIHILLQTVERLLGACRLTNGANS
jgi:two-component system OmpR family response regulator